MLSDLLPVGLPVRHRKVVKASNFLHGVTNRRDDLGQCYGDHRREFAPRSKQLSMRLMFAPSRWRRRSNTAWSNRACFHPERSSTVTVLDHQRCPQRSGPSFTFLSRAPRGPNVAGSSSKRSISLHLGRSMPLDPVGSFNSWLVNGRSHVTRSQRPTRIKGGPWCMVKIDPAIQNAVVRPNRHYWGDIRTIAWAFVVLCETCFMNFTCTTARSTSFPL